MTNTTTKSDGSMITLENIREAVLKLDGLPKSDKWIVINPQGQAFTGTVEQVLPILMQEHPLIKMPLTMSFGPRDRA